MFITKKHLNRRTLLKGAGAAVSLPLLDAMVPAATAQSATAAAERLRFGSVYVPNGIYPDDWHPEQTGKNFELKRVMKPMESNREYLTTHVLVAFWRLETTDGGQVFAVRFHGLHYPL